MQVVKISCQNLSKRKKEKRADREKPLHAQKKVEVATVVVLHFSVLDPKIPSGYATLRVPMLSRFPERPVTLRRIAGPAGRTSPYAGSSTRNTAAARGNAFTQQWGCWEVTGFLNLLLFPDSGGLTVAATPTAFPRPRSARGCASILQGLEGATCPRCSDGNDNCVHTQVKNRENLLAWVGFKILGEGSLQGI